MVKLRTVWGGALVLMVGCGGASGSTETETDAEPQPGGESGPCVDGECLGSLMCLSSVCVDVGDLSSTDPSGSGPGTSGPGTSGPGTSGPGTSGPGTSGPGTTQTAGTSGPGTSSPGTTDRGTDSDSETSGDPPTGGSCKVVDVVPEKSHISFAVDKTGSTSTVKWDHDGIAQTAKISRWNSIYNVLSTVLADFDGDEEMALTLFPGKTALQSYNESACTTSAKAEVSMDLNNADKITLNLPVALASNAGGTAMSRGVDTALKELIDAPDFAPRAVVLITDGESNCAADAESLYELFEVYDDTINFLVSDAYADGIVTYVIGISISNLNNPQTTDGKPDNINPLEKLNELATQGGRPLPGSTKFYQSYNELDLELGLRSALDDAKSCNLVLGEPATQPMATEVEVAGQTYGYDDTVDCATDDGWIYLDGAHTAIQVCGAPCSELKTAGAASVTIGC